MAIIIGTVHNPTILVVDRVTRNMELLKSKPCDRLTCSSSSSMFFRWQILSFIIIIGTTCLSIGTLFDNPNFILFILLLSVPSIAAACELLYLLKEDFDWLLKPKLKEQLSDIRTALGRFDSYFKNWTEAQVRRSS